MVSQRDGSDHIYEELEANEIRLMYVLWHDSRNNYRVSLHRARLTSNHEQSDHVSKGAFVNGEPVEYRAISYTWTDYRNGAAVTYQPFTAYDASEVAHKIQVSEATVEALNDIINHHVDQGVWLWIDQICIDQSSTMEKSTQVSMMKRIFEQATSVFAHLGPASYDSDLALRTMLRHVWNTDQGDRVKTIESFWYYKDEKPVDDQRSDLAKEWMAVESLLNRTWFTRAWVWLEVTALDYDCVLFVCGRGKITLRWIDCFVVALCISRLTLQKDESVVWSYAGIFSLSQRMLKISCWRRQRAIGRPPDLVTLLETLRGCLTTDNRDKIFCVLPFASDIVPGPLALEVDYTLHHYEVSVKFVIWYLQRYTHLGFLTLCNIHAKSNIGWPGWVPDWSDTAAHSTFDMKVAGDSSESLYSPLATMSLPWTERETWPRRPKFLALRGVRIAVVGRTSELHDTTFVDEERVTAQCLPFQPSEVCPFVKKSRREVFLRTVCADVKYHDTENEADEEPLTSAAAINHGAASESHYSRRPSIEEIESDRNDLAWAAMFRRLFYTETSPRHESTNRGELKATMAAAESSSEKHVGVLGLGPQDVKPGDEVWAFVGSSVLHVIRAVNLTLEGGAIDVINLAGGEAQDSVDAPDVPLLRWGRYVGDCFILGLMDGELLEYMAKEDTAPPRDILPDLSREFEIIYLM